MAFEGVCFLLYAIFVAILSYFLATAWLLLPFWYFSGTGFGSSTSIGRVVQREVGVLFLTSLIRNWLNREAILNACCSISEHYMSFLKCILQKGKGKRCFVLVLNSYVFAAVYVLTKSLFVTNFTSWYRRKWRRSIRHLFIICSIRMEWRSAPAARCWRLERWWWRWADEERSSLCFRNLYHRVAIF